MAGRFAILSDIHLNLWSYGSPYSRLDEQLDAIEQALSEVREERMDAVLFCGDMFHTQGQVQTLILDGLWQVLKSCDLPPEKVVFLPGNHDMVFRDNSRPHALAFLERFGHVAGGDSWCTVIDNMPPIYALPYTESEDTLRRFLEKSDLRNALVLLHQGVSGVEVNSKGFVMNELLTPSMIPDDVFHAFTGHYHSFHRVSEKLTIPGALVQHHFGDADEDRGWLNVNYDDDGLKIEHVRSAQRRFRSVEFESLQTLEALMAEYQGSFIRVEGVPAKALADVQAMARRHCLQEPKIVPKSEEHLAAYATPRDVEDLGRLFERYVEVNQLDGELLSAGREIMREVDAVS